MGPSCLTILTNAIVQVSLVCAMQSFTRMFEPFLERWSKAYQAEVGAELRKYGLRVDDLLDPDAHPVRLL